MYENIFMGWHEIFAHAVMALGWLIFCTLIFSPLKNFHHIKVNETQYYHTWFVPDTLQEGLWNDVALQIPYSRSQEDWGTDSHMILISYTTTLYIYLES